MKLYVLAFLLFVCINTSDADSGRSIEKKRKFVSITNKAKEDATIHFISGQENFNRTLKSGEKVRWVLPEKAAPTTFFRVGFGREKGGGNGNGYFSAFLEKYCKRECRWKVLDGGVLKLRLGGGKWKRFKLEVDEEDYGGGDGAPEMGNGEIATSPVSEGLPELESGNSMKWDSPATAPTRGRKKSGTRPRRKAPVPPPENDETAPTPAKHGRPKLKPRNPPGARSPAPVNAAAPSPTKSGRRKLKPRNPHGSKSPAPVEASPRRRKSKPKPRNPHGSESSAPLRSAAPRPPRRGRRKSKPKNPLLPKSPAPLRASSPSPTKNGRRKFKPRNPNPKSPSPLQAPTPSPMKRRHRKLKHRNAKLKSPAPLKASAPLPTKKINKAPTPSPAKKAKMAPPPTEHGHWKSKQWNFPQWESPPDSEPTNWAAPPPEGETPGDFEIPPPENEEPAPDVATLSPAPPPPEDEASGDFESPPPENEEQRSPAPAPPPSEEDYTADAPRAPPPTRLTTPWISPPIEGGDEAEGPNAELPPPPSPARPRSTFYSCIKED